MIDGVVPGIRDSRFDGALPCLAIDSVRTTLAIRPGIRVRIVTGSVLKSPDHFVPEPLCLGLGFGSGRPGCRRDGPGWRFVGR